jgi:hypothetical protein
VSCWNSETLPPETMSNKFGGRRGCVVIWTRIDCCKSDQLLYSAFIITCIVCFSSISNSCLMLIVNFIVLLEHESFFTCFAWDLYHIYSSIFRIILKHRKEVAAQKLNFGKVISHGTQPSYYCRCISQ